LILLLCLVYQQKPHEVPPDFLWIVTSFSKRSNVTRLPTRFGQCPKDNFLISISFYFIVVTNRLFEIRKDIQKLLPPRATPRPKDAVCAQLFPSNTHRCWCQLIASTPSLRIMTLGPGPVRASPAEPSGRIRVLLCFGPGRPGHDHHASVMACQAIIGSVRLKLPVNSKRVLARAGAENTLAAQSSAGPEPTRSVQVHPSHDTGNDGTCFIGGNGHTTIPHNFKDDLRLGSTSADTQRDWALRGEHPSLHVALRPGPPGRGPQMVSIAEALGA
jgi:hypothetical protein